MQVWESVFTQRLKSLTYFRAVSFSFSSPCFTSFGWGKRLVYCLGWWAPSWIVCERSVYEAVCDFVLHYCFFFKGYLRLKEKRVTEGTEERRETEVPLGWRENLASAPALRLEPVETRFGFIWKSCIRTMQSNPCHTLSYSVRWDSMMMLNICF